MVTIARILAAVLMTGALLIGSAQAAEMPSRNFSVDAAKGGFSVALPSLADAKPSADVAPIQVAGRRVRRGVAIGVGLGILGIAAAIAASEARARNRGHYYYEAPVRRASPRHSCARWLRDCDRGYGRACDRYDAYCY